MIHGEHPFAPDPAELDPVRHFRGRLAAPVTVVTSGGGGSETGLTVSSLFVIEGDPGWVQLVAGPSSDLWTTIEETSRFVVHVCRQADRHLAEVFAGLRPSPGGVFADVEVSDSEWGPLIEGLSSRAFCTLVETTEIGSSGVISGRIDQVQTTDFDDPLAYFRGRFRSLQ